MARPKAPRPAAPAQSPAPTAPAAPTRRWPAEFLAPWPSFLLITAALILSGVLIALGLTNNLLWFKRLVGFAVGLGNPQDLGVAVTSIDAAVLLLSALWVLVGTLLHPCIGIAVLTFLRPWLDGYTFPSDNLYFLWGTLFILIAWSFRVLGKKERVTFNIPAILFAAFLAVAFLTSLRSINFDDSMRTLLIWLGYFFLFLTASNLTREPFSRRILLAAIAFTALAEALFAIMQYKHILPYLRQILNQDPRILQAYFGVDTWTPELARRFNINRAFGTVLFPNALAAFLILFIPIALSGAWTNLQRWRQAAPALPKTSATEALSLRYKAIALALTVWLLAAAGLYALFQFPLAYALGELPWYLGPIASIFTAAVLALIPCLGIGWIAARSGVTYALHVLRTITFTFAAFAALYALLLTFSRGGMLALFLALGAVAALLLLRSTPPWCSRLANALPLRLTALLLLTAAALLVTANLRANAQEVPAPAPTASANTAPLTSAPGNPPSAPEPKPPVLTTEGQDLSARDLVDPASFRIRFTYWRVALTMFAANPLTGVGLGCFEWAYPRYQYLGAGDVREAHNSFLQTFCETGILGGLLLMLFWGLVLLRGLRVALTTDNPETRALALGLLAGLLAFLLHAAIDINFSHPTLMFYALLMAAMLCALETAPKEQGTSEAAPPSSAVGQIVLLPVLALAALVAGLSLRIYTQDLALSRVSLISVANDKDLEHRMAVGRHIMITVYESIWGKRRVPLIPFTSAALLIDEPDKVGDFAVAYVPAPGEKNGVRQLRSGDMLPMDAQLLINKPRIATTRARAASERFLAELARIDARWPHNAKLAVYIAKYYSILAEAASHHDTMEKDVPALTEQMLAWSEKALQRNPGHADLYSTLGQMRWNMATLRKDINNVPQYEQAVKDFAQAARLAPNVAQYQFQVASARRSLAEAYARAGANDKAAENYRLADEMEAMAKATLHQRINLGVEAPPM